MDLRSGRYYWLEKDGYIQKYPTIEQNLASEITIIGGGISAALAAYRLTKAGYECLVIEKREIARGSTLASTAILQYEIDKPLAELIGIIGKEKADLAYKLCYQAVKDTDHLCSELSSSVGFNKKKSLYVAKSEKDVELLKKEFELRRALGFDLDYFDQSDIENHFSFSAPAALYSENAAIVDCYKLTHRLFQEAARKGCRIYANSPLTAYEYLGHAQHKKIKLQASNKFTINTNHVVFCTGYETQSLLKQKIVNLHSTYTISTKKLRNTYGWQDNCILWETGNPYTYIRPVGSDRAMIGGLDKPFRNSLLRDILIPFVAKKLIAKFNDYFPEINAEIEYRWAGTFGETNDSLPYIGTNSEYPGAFFSLGFGGNGMTFSLIGTDLLLDYLSGKSNPASEIFSFTR